MKPAEASAVDVRPKAPNPLTVRLSREERAALTSYATSRGQSVSDVVRAAILAVLPPNGNRVTNR